MKGDSAFGGGEAPSHRKIHGSDIKLLTGNSQHIWTFMFWTKTFVYLVFTAVKSAANMLYRNDGSVCSYLFKQWHSPFR